MNLFNIIGNTNRRYYGFDIIRAFSVILVMHMHFLQHFSGALGIDYFMIPFPDPVDMFLICSGFLIGYRFLKDIEPLEKIDRKYTMKFWVMRWTKTLPTYYFMLIFLIFFYALVTRHFHLYFRNFLFIQNLFTHNSIFFRETWTVSVEEWFYISFPLLFMFSANVLKFNKTRSYLFVLLFLIILSLSAKTYYYFNIYTEHTFKIWGNEIREIVILRLDTIAVGLLSAYVCHEHKNIWDKYRYQTLAIGLVIYLGSVFYYWLWSNNFVNNEFTTFYHYVLFYFISPISFALCFPYVKSISYKNNFLSRSVVFVSMTSYAIYLVHGSFLLMIFIALYQFKVCKSVTLLYSGWLLSTFIFSNLVYRYVELPFMNRRKWFIEKLGLEK